MMDDSGTEVSVSSAYCVVYRLSGTDWIVNGEGWSQVHLYRDESDGSHRIVGWTVIDFDVVINCNVSHLTKYKKKTDDFHKFTDEEGNTFGFGFYKKEEAIVESKKFMAAVGEIIHQSQMAAGPQTLPPPMNNKGGQRLSNINVPITSGNGKGSINAPTNVSSMPYPGRTSISSSSSQNSSSNSQYGNSNNTNAPPSTNNRYPPPAPAKVNDYKSNANGQSDTHGNGIPISASSSSSSATSSSSSAFRNLPPPLPREISTTSPAPIILLPPPNPPKMVLGNQLNNNESKQFDPSSSSPSPSFPSSNHSSPSTSSHPAVPLGKMKILPPKPHKVSVPAVVPAPKQSKGAISNVSDILSAIHTQHVRFDPVTRQYQGLPPEWESILNKQFGLDPSKLEGIKLPFYKSRIPCVLQQMREYLFQHDGHLQEGVFRIAPDASESTYVKQQINENRFKGCNDVHIISNLIKVFFRELPVHILSSVDPSKINQCETEEQAEKICLSLSQEPYGSLLLWLLDLCSDIARHSEKNKMNSKNLGIVFGPNLFTPSDKDPMASLLFSQKVANFLHKAIEWRMSHPPTAVASSHNGNVGMGHRPSLGGMGSGMSSPMTIRK